LRNRHAARLGFEVSAEMIAGQILGVIGCFANRQRRGFSQDNVAGNSIARQGEDPGDEQAQWQWK
jgi:hypothetical protein